jgi:hypothetical protein
MGNRRRGRRLPAPSWGLLLPILRGGLLLPILRARSLPPTLRRSLVLRLRPRYLGGVLCGARLGSSLIRLGSGDGSKPEHQDRGRRAKQFSWLHGVSSHCNLRAQPRFMGTRISWSIYRLLVLRLMSSETRGPTEQGHSRTRKRGDRQMPSTTLPVQVDGSGRARTLPLRSEGI